MDDLGAGHPLLREYGIAADDREFVVYVNGGDVHRFALDEVYAKRRAEQEGVSGRKVLVVDDEEPIRSLMTRLLARRGLTSDTAADGADALVKLERGGYGLVLLDLMMPKRDGDDVLKVLRATRHFVPVIVVSAAGERRVGDLDPFLVTALVRKPFDIDIVAEIAAAIIGAGGCVTS
jgi:CheY-like chemotaxis protein